MKARHLTIALSLLSISMLPGCGSSRNDAVPPPADPAGSAPVTLASTGSLTSVDAAEASVQPSAGRQPVSPEAGHQAPQGTPTGPANPLLGRTIRILALGDSMTAGDESASDGFRSYRGALSGLLRDRGYQVDFVGGQQSQPAVGGDPDHEGYGGAYIGPGGATNNLDDRLPGILAAHDPDIIILAFGWNSVFNEGPQAGTKYRDIVKRIAAAKPQAHLVLATLSPTRGQDESTSAASLVGYRGLNAAARELAGLSATDRLSLADLATGGFQSAEYWDVIHWLQPGADRAAQILLEAIEAGPLKH